MTSPFSTYLSDLLSRRGQAATLSNQSGVPTSYISKLCKGDVLPSPEVLTKLIGPLGEADKAALVREYLLLHLPANAPMVRIIVNDEDGPQDRLLRAIEGLDPATRDSLAVLVEAVQRAPEQGTKALQAVGAWFRIGDVTAGVEGADSGNPDGKDVGGKMREAAKAFDATKKNQRTSTPEAKGSNAPAQ